MTNTQFAAPFGIQHHSIGSLFINNKMVIPEMQRPYAWTDTEANELIGDIQRLMNARTASNPTPQHFFGVLVVLTVAGSRDEVIDGQQRTTTVSILLAEVQNALKRLEERCFTLEKANANNRAQALHYGNVAKSCNATYSPISNLLQFQDGFDTNGTIKFSPRVLVSPEIRLTFQSLITGGDGKVNGEQSKPARNLRSIAEHFRDEVVEPKSNKNYAPLDCLKYLQILLETLTDSLIVVRLDTPAAGSAYELFESLNARGIPLNALDLLKVWMLAVFSEAQSNGTQVSNAMRDMASDDIVSQLAFFEDFYSARCYKTPPKRSSSTNPKKFAIEVRRDLFKDPSHVKGPVYLTSTQLTAQISSEVLYMKALTPTWFALRGLSVQGSHLPPQFSKHQHHQWLSNRLDNLLNVLRHQNGYPFLTVAADVSAVNPQDFVDLVHVLERFFFRYRTICGGPEKKITETYWGFLKDIDANKRLNLTKVRADLAKLISDHAPDDVFRRGLLEKLDYRKASSRNVMKYFFETLDEYSGNPTPMLRAGKLNLGDWHLEHIVPQNPAAGSPTLGDDDLNSIGNLCLLDPPINTRLSNMDFSAKKQEAQRLRTLAGVQQINIRVADSAQIFYHSPGNTWAISDVAKRIKALQDFACQVFKP